jgi:hypothetical protein
MKFEFEVHPPEDPWMQVSITPLEPHPNDPEGARALRDLERS